MKTEQEPSLPAREKNKNKRQDPKFLVNFKDLPCESSQDSWLSEIVNPDLISQNTKEFIYSLFENNEDRSLFLNYSIDFLLKLAEIQGDFLQLATDFGEIYGHLQDKEFQEKLLAKAKELDEKLAREFLDPTLETFQHGVCVAIAKYSIFIVEKEDSQ